MGDLFSAGTEYSSFIIYFIKNLIFHDVRAILSDLLSQIAFLPIYILLSTIVIDSLLSRREKGQRIKKLNMLNGAFFSESGIALLQSVSKFDRTSEEWAVFHLTEELASRADLNHLDDADYDHFKSDIERAYRLLIFEWLTYMIHLKGDYPFLFSFAARTNPFDPDARAEISG